MKSLFEALFLLAAGAVLFFYGAAQRPITSSAEGRVARVAQEMLDSGEWIVPHLNGAVRKEKPPLSSWAVALTARACGSRTVEPIHAYLPTGLAALALALVLFVWLRKTDPPDAPGFAPFFAGLVALTAPGFLLLARSAQLDMLLALFVTCAYFGYWQWRTEGCRGGLLMCYAMLGLTVLTKGHVGLVIFLPGVIAWHFVERARGALPRNAGGAAWHLAGLGLLLAIVLPWAIPFLQNSGIAWADFQKEGLERFGKKTGHQEPFYFYLLNIPGWMLPWFLLVPPALWYTRDLPPDHRSPLRRLCVGWFAIAFVFFSILSAKQRHYAAPFLPPLALLIADAAERWLHHPKADVARYGRNVLAGVIVLTGLALLVFPAAMKSKGLLLPGDAAACWTVAALGALLFFAAAWKVTQCVRCQTLLAAACVCAVIVFVHTEERSEVADSPVDFCGKVRAHLPPDAELVDYNVAFANNVWRAQVLFYLGRIVKQSDDPLAEYVKTPGRYILANDKWLADVPKERYDILVEDHSFLGHKRDAYLIRSK